MFKVEISIRIEFEEEILVPEKEIERKRERYNSKDIVQYSAP
jgi:hypothetical protein